MTSPVGFGSHQPPTMAEVAQEERGQDVEEVSEVEISEPSSLQVEFNSLMQSYITAVRLASGCGIRAQGYINAAYKNLTTFSEAHAEFKALLPEKYRAYDASIGETTTADTSRTNDELVFQ